MSLTRGTGPAREPVLSAWPMHCSAQLEKGTEAGIKGLHIPSFTKALQFFLVLGMLSGHFKTLPLGGPSHRRPEPTSGLLLGGQLLQVVTRICMQAPQNGEKGNPQARKTAMDGAHILGMPRKKQ